MVAPSLDTRTDLQRRLITKAWKDPEFKKNVVNDPKGMFETQLGRQLPAQLKIYVHEENEDTVHFSIPQPPSDMSELSEEDLERLAGGTDLLITASVTAFVATGATLFAASAAAVTKGTGAW